jgi:hypothetical protein
MRLLARPGCISIVFLAALLASSSVALGSPGPPRWRLASDFLTAPDQSNPSPDSFGNPNVWGFMEGTVLHRPSSYSLLGDFVPNAFGVDGLEQWEGSFTSTGPLDRLPAVGINASGADQFLFTFNWPANTIRVHPLGNDAVIVGWRSPVPGNVRVEVGVSDLDPSCGDGVGWFIDNGEATLTSGNVPNGGAGAVSLTVHVKRQTQLYFIVTDGGLGDYSCDSTGLTVDIHRGVGVRP